MITEALISASDQVVALGPSWLNADSLIESFGAYALLGIILVVFIETGLSLASKRLMRLGIVLLGLKLSVFDIASLGWVTIASTIAVVLLTFAGTYWLGRWFKLPGHQPLLIATGFSICGASAIGAGWD